MILWTASAPASDNTCGSLPCIAPMKISFLKSIPGNRARCGFALLVSLISVWFALTPGAAQLKNQKRIMSLQVGEVSEGARVTVVSDLALSDYEAFRRGDRFYVRIPLADFIGLQPRFRGDGFDDVQIQKVGDSVVVSFKLQPGATARVDQRSNRLDVIFSAPNRMARGSRTNTGFNRGTNIPTDGIVRSNNPRTLQLRRRDAAGPMPPGSPGLPRTSRERVVTGGTSDFQTSRSQSALTNPRGDSGRRDRNRPAGSIGASRSGSSPGASPTTSKSEASSGIPKSGASQTISKSEPSPAVSRYEPSPAATPSSTPGYPALATSTPAAPVASQPVKSSSGLTGPQKGKSRTDIALEWIKVNRQATLLGALLLLCLLVFLAALLIRRRKNVVKAKRAGTTLAQPKHSPAIAQNSAAVDAVGNSPTSNMASRNFTNENTASPRTSELNPLAVPVASDNAPRTSRIHENADGAKQKPEQALARSAAVAAPPNHASVPTSPSSRSTSDEDQEREVFEL
jgi:hypothetical protein